jgi:hypothetical protein
VRYAIEPPAAMIARDKKLSLLAPNGIIFLPYAWKSVAIEVQ